MFVSQYVAECVAARIPLGLFCCLCTPDDLFVFVFACGDGLVV